MFGACFYGVRINALLVLGYLKVTLSELLPGAVIAMYMSNISVNLVPLRVFQCADAFGASTPQLISQQGAPSKTIDWTSSGCVAVHDAGEAGVDIFFALTDVATSKVIVFADQRKRELGQCQPRHAEDYLLKLSASPDFLVGTGARLVHVIMNCDSTWGISLYDGPPDCYLVGRDKRGEFYGALSCHPASSPTISIKSACKAALKAVLQGVAEDVDQLVDEIVRKRKEARGGFNNPEELRSFIETKRLRVQLDDQHADFSAYS